MTEPPDTKQIERLLALKQALGTATDELNRRILAFEADLKQIGIGVPVWVELTPTTKLGYGKWEGDWHILVQYRDFEEDKTNSLTHASRGIRLYCYRHLHLLLPAIEHEAAKLLTHMRTELEITP